MRNTMSLLGILCAAALLPLSSFAAEVTWNGGDGNFDDAS